MILENLTKDWRGALLLIFRGDDPPIVRPAAFLFDMPLEGFAWVEPHYLDPLGPTSPALHSRPAASLSYLSERRPELGLSFVDPETGERGMIYEWVPDDLPRAPALDEFAAQLKAEGRTMQGERERLRTSVVRSVAA
jgi:hypothetical protein